MIYTHIRKVDVTGIDNHEMPDLKVVDAMGRTMSHLGPIIVILCQYAYHGIGRTIHSCSQLEYHKNMVNDRSMKAGGTQCIRTHDGYVIPLDIIAGLPYMKMFPPTQKEIDTLPHVYLTSRDEWKPSSMDCMLSDKDDWYQSVSQLTDGLIQTPFDEYGNYRE